MRIRYRTYKPLFGREVLVLQVGIESKLGCWTGTDFTCPPPTWDTDEIVVSWRDAKTEDLVDIYKGV